MVSPTQAPALARRRAHAHHHRPPPADFFENAIREELEIAERRHCLLPLAQLVGESSYTPPNPEPRTLSPVSRVVMSDTTFAAAYAPIRQAVLDMTKRDVDDYALQSRETAPFSIVVVTVVFAWCVALRCSRRRAR